MYLPCFLLISSRTFQPRSCSFSLLTVFHSPRAVRFSVTCYRPVLARQLLTLAFYLASLFISSWKSVDGPFLEAPPFPAAPLLLTRPSSAASCPAITCRAKKIPAKFLLGLQLFKTSAEPSLILTLSEHSKMPRRRLATSLPAISTNETLVEGMPCVFRSELS